MQLLLNGEYTYVSRPFNELFTAYLCIILFPLKNENELIEVGAFT